MNVLIPHCFVKMPTTNWSDFEISIEVSILRELGYSPVLLKVLNKEYAAKGWVKAALKLFVRYCRLVTLLNAKPRPFIRGIRST